MKVRQEKIGLHFFKQLKTNFRYSKIFLGNSRVKSDTVFEKAHLMCSSKYFLYYIVTSGNNPNGNDSITQTGNVVNSLRRKY